MRSPESILRSVARLLGRPPLPVSLALHWSTTRGLALTLLLIAIPSNVAARVEFSHYAIDDVHLFGTPAIGAFQRLCPQPSVPPFYCDDRVQNWQFGHFAVNCATGSAHSHASSDATFGPQDISIQATVLTQSGLCDGEGLSAHGVARAFVSVYFSSSMDIMETGLLRVEIAGAMEIPEGIYSGNGYSAVTINGLGELIDYAITDTDVAYGEGSFSFVDTVLVTSYGAMTIDFALETVYRALPEPSYSQPFTSQCSITLSLVDTTQCSDYATDTDGDGLPDCWETDGIPVDSNPANNYELANADPNQKDIYVELDAMEGLAPQSAALDAIVAAFGAVPNELLVPPNPNGADGIRLHIVVDDGDLNIPRATWADASAFYAIKYGLEDPAYGFGTDAERASELWPEIALAKGKAFRYCIAADSSTGEDRYAFGQGEIPGNDFWVLQNRVRAVFGNPTPLQEAATFMHELGHTLGLHHGGHQYDPGDYNSYEYDNKPNYYSIMNRIWTLPVLAPPHSALATWQASWKLDYSRETLHTLDESCLDEASGIGGSPSVLVPAGEPQPGGRLVPMGGGVDWDRNGVVGDACVPQDINRIQTQYPATPGGVLEGSADWLSLAYLPTSDANWDAYPAAGVAGVLASARAQSIAGGCGLSVEDYMALQSMEFDCNANGAADDADIAAGSSLDENLNGIPDECEYWAVPVAVPSRDGVASLQFVVTTCPNPFVRSTRIQFATSARGHVSVCIFGLAGECVAELLSQVLDVGTYSLEWQGLGSDGRLVSAGIYFLRLDTPSGKLVRKITLLR